MDCADEGCLTQIFQIGMFKDILNYYRECFAMVDVFHCNSRHTAEIYRKYLPAMNAAVIPITHGGIKDRRKSKCFNTDCLRLSFVGSSAPYKGLPMLIEVLKSIDNKKWKLNVWGGKVGRDASLPIYYRGAFCSNMLEEVYGNTDLVVVPSICDETFSFVTLEALSFGTPVLVSDHVGAKDIVCQYAPRFVYQSEKDLGILLLSLIKDRMYLRDYHQQIMSQTWHYSMREHARDIIDKVYVG